MLSILLVEDERLELETLRDYVDWKKLGIGKVYTARNGRTALECIAEHEPDIIITDIQMPVMNGIELAKRVREEGYRCKIVFLSGYDDFSYLKVAFQVQAVDYILKPFSVEEVEKLILRIKEELEKEQITEDSLKLASGQFLVRVCTGKEENLEEMSQKYFGRGKEEAVYGMLAVYGTGEEMLAARITEFPEVQYAFALDQMICVIFQSYISFQDVAKRMARVAEGMGNVAWCDRKLSLQELEGVTQALISQQEEMFYGEPGEIKRMDISHRESGTGINREAYHKARKTLRHLIILGGEQEALKALETCLQELKKGDRRDCQRDCYGLYLNLHNRLELEDEQLLQEMDARENKPELGILEAGFFSQIQSALKKYVKALCTYSRKRQENPNYYVAMRVKEYIEKHYAGVCSVEEMAEGLHLSPNYLRSLFKVGTGQTILEYLTDYRLEKACKLLKDKTKRVKDISVQVGYENVSYFSQLFVKRYGVTPNEYRKMV